MTLPAMHANSCLLIDKPLHWTSFDVVKKVRHLLQVKKVGHAGTLDPLATGLLICCTGRKTKEIGTYQEMAKTYEGILGLGKTTPSFDLGTPFDEERSYGHIHPHDIHRAVAGFTGFIQQMPPSYSALKVGGKRAYALARKGEKVELQPRAIHIHAFEITQIDIPFVHFRIVCSRGTYVRSIAHELGKKLGVGGYLATLRRTRIGDYLVEDAIKMEHLAKGVAATKS